MHLQHVVKHQGSTNAINLNSPESLQMHVEARLMQLETAISMELWQVSRRMQERLLLINPLLSETHLTGSVTLGDRLCAFSFPVRQDNITS